MKPVTPMVWTLSFVLLYMAWATLFKGLHWDGATETFVVVPADLDARIVEIYQGILGRNPTGKEQTLRRKQMTEGKTTLDALRRELKGSDEYINNLKMQNNGLAPELPRIIADRDLINHIGAMYRKERKAEMPANMILVLRDVYVILNYDDAHFIAFLRMDNYDELEYAVKNDYAFNRDKLIAWMRDNVDTAALDAEAAKIQAELDAEAAKYAKSNLSADDLAMIKAMIDDAAAGSTKGCAPVGGADTQSDEYLRYLQSLCQQAFDKDSKEAAMCSRIPLQTHEGNPYVLRPEFAWSVPQQRAPVCTTLGQPSLVQPTVAFTDSLPLTDLADAADTAVGSMMPKFQFAQYVDGLPSQSQCAAYGAGKGEGGTAGLTGALDKKGARA
jgi:hypothetical protein